MSIADDYLKKQMRNNSSSVEFINESDTPDKVSTM